MNHALSSALSLAVLLRMPVLSDWTALTNALVEDSAGTASSQVDSCNLLNVYVAAIRRACGTLELPTAAAALASKKALPAKARNSMKESQKEATLVLMRALPKLMRKFQSNHKQVRASAPSLSPAMPCQGRQRARHILRVDARVPLVCEGALSVLDTALRS